VSFLKSIFIRSKDGFRKWVISNSRNQISNPWWLTCEPRSVVITNPQIIVRPRVYRYRDLRQDCLAKLEHSILVSSISFDKGSVHFGRRKPVSMNRRTLSGESFIWNYEYYSLSLRAYLIVHTAWSAYFVAVSGAPMASGSGLEVELR